MEIISILKRKKTTKVTNSNILSMFVTLAWFMGYSYGFRMSVTGGSYLQNFSKVQYIIIQDMLSLKSMKNFTDTNEKLFRVCKSFDHKKYHSFLIKAVSIQRKAPKMKFILKKSELLVKKSN